jgi:hypothetical protein
MFFSNEGVAKPMWIDIVQLVDPIGGVTTTESVRATDPVDSWEWQDGN